jgi:hypothetical protein
MLLLLTVKTACMHGRRVQRGQHHQEQQQQGPPAHCTLHLHTLREKR